jgi:glutamine amidotransferase
MSSIAIIDYGMGNLHSIAKAFEHVAGRERVVVSSEHAVIRAADRVVFPGVGAIRDCIAELRRTGLDDVIRELPTTRPLLGVCLGLQALFETSEENDGTDCLGILPGRVVRFPKGLRDSDSREHLKIPHMGWNRVMQTHDHAMWKDIPSGERFYFVHSYHAVPSTQTDVAGTTEYGREFVSVVARENLFAVQFHPEKSQHAGLQLLANFIAWNGES